MEILSIEDLYRLRDCEVKELLKNNDKFKVGGYVYVRGEIGKIIALDHSRICYKRHCMDFFETTYKSGSNLLTYDFYKKLEVIRIENKFNNISQEMFNKFILKRAIEFYGEENVDMYDNTLIVKLGNIEVKNELGMSYLITDMWMRINLYGKRLYGLTFYRNSFKPEEVSNGRIFIHPHAYPSKDLETSNICFGSTDIAHFISGLKNSFNVKSIDQFFLCIDTFLKTESLQGVPYMKISSIYENQYRRCASYFDNYFKDIVTNLFQNIDKFTYTFQYPESENYLNKFPFVEKSYISNLIYDYVINSNNQEMIDNVIVNSDGVGPIKAIENNRNISYPEILPFRFKGKFIDVFQKPSEINEDNFNLSYPKVVDPVLVEEICDFINEKFNDFLLKKYNE